MAGEKADKLGAAVREVHEAATSSGDAYRALAAMGFKLQYQVMRRGLRHAGGARADACLSCGHAHRCVTDDAAAVATSHRFRLLLSGQVVDVSLLLVEGQGDDGRTASVVPGLWLVRTRCTHTVHLSCSAPASSRRSALLSQVEAICKTTQEAYPDAVAALVAAKAKLAAVVELQRPSLHLSRPGEAPPPQKPQLGLKRAGAV